MKKQQYIGTWILAVLIISVFFVMTLFKTSQPMIHNISYTQFIQMVRNHEFKRVEIEGRTAIGYPPPAEKPAPPAPPLSPPASTTEATPLRPAPSKPAATLPQAAKPEVQPVQDEYHVIIPGGDTGINQLIKDELTPNNVDVDVHEPKNDGMWMGILTTTFIPIIFLIALIMMVRNAQGGGSQALSFGKSRAKMAMDSKVKVTFNDVAGIDEAKAELEEVVDFLKNGERYQKLGAKIPKGVLLVGSPGTGKTLLAKAVAGEAGVPFFSISGSDFVEMFVGVGASRVRDLFEQAKKHAPCIIFVDEIDAVGRQRGAGMGGGHDEREQTLNQLLVEMDGFDPHTGIIVVAATNRPDILDNALLRPGRFDRQVMIDRPDVQGREQILKVHAKGKPLASDVDLKLLAKRTPGFTGADLANLLNEGALLAARHDKDVIHMSDIENSIDKVLAGPEKKNKIMTEKDKEMTAYHEVGHALVAVMTPGSDPLRKVTIIPRGMALGITWITPDADKVSMTKKQLMASIAVFLGGLVAEEVVYNDTTTGVSNDLEKVTSTARRIVTVYGMNDKLGPITYGKRNEHVFMGRDFGTERDYSEEVASLIDREIRNIVEDQRKYVRTLLTDNRDMVDAIVKVLLEKETLDDKEFYDIMDRVKAARQNGSGRVDAPALEPPHSERGLVIAPGIDDRTEQ